MKEGESFSKNKIKLRFNGQRAQNTIIVTSIYWVIYVYYVITSYFNYDPSFDMKIAPLIDIHIKWSETFSYIQLSLEITQSIVFMQWFRRAYYNLHRNVDNLAYTDGWAVAGWLIPIINLYRPFVITKELYIETERILEEKYSITFKKTNITVLIIWWIINVFSNITAWLIIFSVFFMNNKEGIGIYYKLASINHILFIIVTLIHLKIVKNYSDMENLWKKFEDKKQTDEYDLDENE